MSKKSDELLLQFGGKKGGGRVGVQDGDVE